MRDRILVIDVESVGLHGPAFAVGFVLIDFDGHATNEGIFAVDPMSLPVIDLEGLKWVTQNVKIAEYNCKFARTVRDRFWAFWKEAEDRSVMAADVNWPVESNFLSACINDDLEGRRWDGPYPLLDIASFRLGAGEDSMTTQHRLDNELPPHHPLNDARQSARQLAEALKKNPKLVTLLEGI